MAKKVPLAFDEPNALLSQEFLLQRAGQDAETATTIAQFTTVSNELVTLALLCSQVLRRLCCAKR